MINKDKLYLFVYNNRANLTSIINIKYDPSAHIYNQSI
jgi:hypothetical protein